MFFQRFDPKWVDPDGMTYEEYQAAMDKMWPRMVGTGRGRHRPAPRRPKAAVYSDQRGCNLQSSAPLTEEDRLEADWLWDSKALPGTSPGTVTPKKTHWKNYKIDDTKFKCEGGILKSLSFNQTATCKAKSSFVHSFN
ncbi:hypothetical protein [Methanosarcina sp.]|uniref:hypothetical protein n=1 Tax=Methanosarcina sp. TaxID=2213 RepID=UPI003C711B5E